MIISTLNTPAAKSLIANMPIVILFKAVRGAFFSAPKADAALQGRLPSASFR
ncbi:hypothetical protein [Pelomonas sp. KK5]|uniref:hypothetical protein n=1 Tax=Pelomonas sp. KK5 TaxID=1855730 RepID=UPI001301BBF9|nr:hypothetical protein [Pelomonas sp. KK5]